MAIHSRMLVGCALIAALFTACGGDDDGVVPGFDAAADPRCVVDVGDPIPFMCPCEVADDQCDTAAGDMCFMFNERGPHCTHACDGAEDCPAPSNDCNGMGVCKAPD